ncbi:uncharacterized protein LOC131226901 [Magnolia sinica]|uniref:uncharacterized protein LOC131226901 n=1 Tax=Magnolia sinica TaxID=86752 RepID=UPI002659CA81|nr:uncharacterized protein LOC131226901 [Magnolia sinica]
MKRLKAVLKIWNTAIFGNVFQIVQRAEDKVNKAEAILTHSRSDEDRVNLNLAEATLKKALLQQEIFWKQKFRITWLREGDRNTKFFHASVIDKRRQASIKSIKLPSGPTLHSEADIGQEAVNHFSNIFKSDPSPTPSSLLDCIPPLISVHMNSFLLSPLDLTEVRHAVVAIPLDSAPSSDGFSRHFFSPCWDIIKHDILEAALEFFKGGLTLRAFWCTSIFLIPKKKNATNFSDYRPISLCNCI